MKATDWVAIGVVVFYGGYLFAVYFLMRRFARRR